jgi:hypothetical protein
MDYEPTAADMRLLLDSNRGRYLAQGFAESYIEDQWTGVSDEDRDILLAGPDNDNYEAYDDAWATVLDNARWTDPATGEQWYLHQDGDCWIVRENAEIPEEYWY